MKLKEILEQVEVKHYKTDKPCDFRKLLKKADSGNAKAMFDAVQTINYNGLAGDDSDDEMLKRQLSYIKKLSSINGYKYMCIFMGDAYARGNGVKKDIKKAIRWYKKAAKEGTKFGNECIGMIYFNGTEVPADYKKAYKYFTKDNCKKSFCTTYALGEMYRQGLFVEKDIQKAWDYYYSIVTDRSLYYELDDYYWRACYRLGSLNLDNAIKNIGTAKRIFDERDYNADASDITKKEIDQKWRLVKEIARKNAEMEVKNMDKPMRKVCANCKEKYFRGDKYCRFCGAPMGKPDYIEEDFAMLYGPPPIKRIHTCANCGHSWKTFEMIDKGRYCPKCGGDAPATDLGDDK